MYQTWDQIEEVLNCGQEIPSSTETENLLSSQLPRTTCNTHRFSYWCSAKQKTSKINSLRVQLPCQYYQLAHPKQSNNCAPTLVPRNKQLFLYLSIRNLDLDWFCFSCASSLKPTAKTHFLPFPGHQSEPLPGCLLPHHAKPATSTCLCTGFCCTVSPAWERLTIGIHGPSLQILRASVLAFHWERTNSAECNPLNSWVSNFS